MSIANFDKARLRDFVIRVENIDEQVSGLNEDKKEVLKEAAATGFDAKTIKRVLARRKRERKNLAKVQEEETLFSLYWDHCEADE